MLRSFALTAVLFAAMLLDGAARAQQPLSGDSCVSTSLQTPPGGCPPPAGGCPPPPPLVVLPTYQPGVVWDREGLFAIELMLGQESGVRGQLTLSGDKHDALVVEGFFGELFHDLGSAQALGAGARYLWWTNWFEGIHSFQFGPGVDVFFQLNHNGLILLTPSLDLAWTDKLSADVRWEIGLDTGLGIGVAGRNHHGASGAGDVTPLISLYTGLRF